MVMDVDVDVDEEPGVYDDLSARPCLDSGLKAGGWRLEQTAHVRAARAQHG